MKWDLWFDDECQMKVSNSFYILDSFFLSLLHNKFGSAGYFIPLAKTKQKFCFCFLLVFLQDWLYLATTNKHMVTFFLQVCCSFVHWVEAWNLIIAGIYDFHKLWKRASIIIIIIIIIIFFICQPGFITDIFTPKKKKKKQNNNIHNLSGYFF